MPDIGFKIDFPISMPDVFLSSARLILHSDPKLKIPFGNCWEKTGNILQSISIIRPGRSRLPEFEIKIVLVV